MEKENIRYLKALYQAYIETTPSLCVDFKKMANDLDFLSYLAELKKKQKFYRKALAELGVLRNKIILELGTGVLDTITKPNDPTFILTDFSTTFYDSRISKESEEDNRTIIKGSLSATSKKLTIKPVNSNRYFNLLGSNSYVIAHNPFSLLKTLDNLLVASEAGFKPILGMYGSNTDFNKDQKLETLYKLAFQFKTKVKTYQDSNYYAGIIKK